MPVRQATRFFLKTLIGVAAIMLSFGVIAAIALFWRLSQGPVDMGFALPHIERALLADGSDLHYDIGAAQLVWEGGNQPVLIAAENVSVRSGTVPFFFAPSVNIDLSLRSFLLGRLGIEAVEMRDISLSLTRAGDGRINISGSEQRDVYGPQRIGVSRDVTLSGVMDALPKIGRLRISEARIIYNDLIAGQVNVFNGADLTIRKSILLGRPDIDGVVVLPYDTDTTSGILVGDFTYDGDDKRLNVTTALDGLNPAHLLPSLIEDAGEWPLADLRLSGQILLGLEDDFSLHHIGFKGRSEGGDVTWQKAWGEEILSLSMLEVDFLARLDSGDVALNTLTVGLAEGTSLNATAQAKLGDATALTSLNAEWDITSLKQNEIARFWPRHIPDTLAEKWMTERLSAGTYTGITGRVGLNANADGTLPYPQEVDVAFAFTDMDIDYANPLTPVTQVTGRGQMTGKAMDLNVDRGIVGDMQVTSGTLAFDDLITTGAGEGDINLAMNGPVPSVFDYLSGDPINATDDLPFDVGQTDGQADMTVRIRFPTVADLLVEDVKVTAEAELTDLLIPDVIRGLPLSGGPFALSATTEHYKLTGSGRLGDTPVTLEWEEYFSPQPEADFLSRVNAKLTADADIRERFGSDPYSWITGVSQVDVTYTESKTGGADRLDVTANMREAEITIPELNVTKSKGQPATLTLSGRVEGEALTAIMGLNLRSDALTLNGGRIGLTPSGRLMSASFDAIRTDTNTARLKAERENTSTPLKILITGEQFDATPFLDGDRDEGEDGTGGEKDSYRINLEVDRLITGPGRSINTVLAYLETNSAGHTTRLEMDALVGSGALQVRYDPGQQPFSLRLEAEDAGATLKAFGLYDYMVKGRLVILGQPMRQGAIEDVQGRATITDFSISEAPILAKLFNALSISGLFDMLGNSNNLSFTRLESDFTWVNDPRGGIYTFNDGAVRGNSMGLTFSGAINQQTKTTDITGTAVPVSAINSIISRIPLIGDILTGGDGGGLIAATFTLSGPSDDPVASVNLLSVLAPGIIRRILFEREGGDTTQTPESEPQPREERSFN